MGRSKRFEEFTTFFALVRLVFKLAELLPEHAVKKQMPIALARTAAATRYLVILVLTFV